MKLVSRLLALMMVLALAIPVVAISEEGTLIDFKVNQTVFNKGDTLVVSWKADPNKVSIDSVNVDLYLEDKATVGGIEFKALAVHNDFSTDEAEGTYSFPIDGSFYGEGYVSVSYLEIFTSRPVLTQKIPITINKPADAEPYFDFSVSKHPSKWQTGDVIDFTWNHNLPGDIERMEMSCMARNGRLEVVGDMLSATEPGTYKYTVPDVSSIAILSITLDVIKPRSSSIRETGYAYTYYPGMDDEPTEEPTVAPTEKPTPKPTDKPTTAPTAAPTKAPGNPSEPVELNLDEITIGVKQSVDTVKVVSGTVATWTSSNEKVATVDANGKITGVKKGTATITATSADGESDSVEVTVVAKNKGVKKIKLNKKKATIKQGEKLALKATLTPADAKNKKIIWTSSNTAVATVNAKGKVKAVGVGEATITAISSSGKAATCKITVTGAKVKKITIEGVKKMKVGEQQQLIANILPEFAANKDVTWKTSAKKIATVDENGIVTALKKGTVTITAIAKDGSRVKATFIIKIKK